MAAAQRTARRDHRSRPTRSLNIQRLSFGYGRLVRAGSAVRTLAHEPGIFSLVGFVIDIRNELCWGLITGNEGSLPQPDDMSQIVGYYIDKIIELDLFYWPRKMNTGR